MSRIKEKESSKNKIIGKQEKEIKVKTVLKMAMISNFPKERDRKLINLPSPTPSMPPWWPPPIPPMPIPIPPYGSPPRVPCLSEPKVPNSGAKRERKVEREGD